jgi:hypothetical protein
MGLTPFKRSPKYSPNHQKGSQKTTNSNLSTKRDEHSQQPTSGTHCGWLIKQQSDRTLSKDFLPKERERKSKSLQKKQPKPSGTLALHAV